MSRFIDLLFGKRDVAPSPSKGFIGFPVDGGIAPSGVTATTAIGISAVWRCLDIIANGVSQLEWSERRGNLELPPSRIVRRPQAERTRREWTSLVVSTLALFDVCYLLKTPEVDSEGVPIGLLYLHPNIITPELVDTFFIFPPKTYWLLGKELSADQLVVIHRSPQPTIFDTQGGVINLARRTFAAAIAAENYASRYWQGGGPTSLYLSTDANLSDATAESLAERWRDKRAQGPDRPPVLSGGLKAYDLGIDATSASAVEARKQLVADIGRYFGIPTAILNAPAGDSETYNTTELQGIGLVAYTLQNYINAVEDAISDQLPGSRYLYIDPEPLKRAGQYSRAQAWQLATAGRAWMTPDEVREQEGLPPIENPDDLLPPQTTRVTIQQPGGQVNAPAAE